MFDVDSLGSGATYSQKLRAAQYMRAAGVRFARVAVYWHDLQQDGPTFSWTLQSLHETAQALIEAGITPYFTLQETACFARSLGPFCSTDAVRHPPDAQHSGAWATYVQQMVTEFPNVHYWGIWNEPNSSFLQSDTGDRLTAYKQLVEQAAPIIHASGGLVIAPDLGPGDDSSTGLTPMQWLASFLSTHGSYVDIVAVHVYGNETEAQYVNTMQGYASVLGGGPWDLWLTETARGGEVAATDAQQDAGLAAAYGAMNSGSVPKWTKTFYYNAGQFLDANGNVDPNQWGLVHDLWTATPHPRPAYNTLKQMSCSASVNCIQGSVVYDPSYPTGVAGLSWSGPAGAAYYKVFRTCHMTNGYSPGWEEWSSTSETNWTSYDYVMSYAGTSQPSGSYMAYYVVGVGGTGSEIYRSQTVYFRWDEVAEPGC